MGTIFAILESIIDFPQADLSAEVWNNIGNEYTIKPEIKEKILDLISQYPGLDLSSIYDTIHIVGSICTNQYTDDSDIDVHIIPKTLKYTEEQVQHIFKWFNKHAEDLEAFICGHQLEIYLQLNPVQDYLSDGCYDLLNNEWKVGPKIVGQDYNPYEDFSGLTDEIRTAVEGADELFGELKRDIVDFDTMLAALNRLPREYQEKIKTMLRSKLGEIEQNIKDLYGLRGEWVQARRNASRPLSIESALHDIELAKKWKNSNALFKFIHRYKYIKTIDALTKILDTGKLGKPEVETIKTILGRSSV